MQNRALRQAEKNRSSVAKADMVSSEDNHTNPSSTEKHYHTVSRWMDTDKKFVKFLLGHLFTSGLYVWWVLGLLFIILIAFIFLVFFAALIDTDYLLGGGPPLSKENWRDVNDHAGAPYRQKPEVSGADPDKWAIWSQAKRLLGNPDLPKGMTASLPETIC